MTTFIRKLVRQVRIDGLGVFAKVPIWLRTQQELRRERALGIATMGRVEAVEAAGAGTRPQHLDNAVFYAPLQFPKFDRLMRAARPFDPDRYTFIDYGAGKGRALALAAGMGFRRIVGVELFESLCRQARENIDALARRDPGAALRDAAREALDALDLPAGERDPARRGLEPRQLAPATIELALLDIAVTPHHSQRDLRWAGDLDRGAQEAHHVVDLVRRHAHMRGFLRGENLVQGVHGHRQLFAHPL
jgi:hypothetical protein